MNKVIFMSLAMASGLVFSACSTNGGELFKQALKSNSPGVVQVVEPSDAPVKIIKIGEYGYVLTDLKSKALYIKDGDTSILSTCYEECAIAWPPLTVLDPADVSGDYSTLERTAGEFQVTYMGQPLYRYTPDSTRKVTGDNYKDVWHVVTMEVEETE